MQEDRQLGASAKHFGCKWGGLESNNMGCYFGEWRSTAFVATIHVFFSNLSKKVV